MTDPPCRRCTPPRRYPGCQCDAKRQWDKQRAAARSAQRGEGDYYSYTADRIYGARRRM